MINECMTLSYGLPYILTFPQVLFLFQDKHVMVEKLLQFFIAKVDAYLLEAVEVKDLEPSNVEDSNKTDPGQKY